MDHFFALAFFVFFAFAFFFAFLAIVSSFLFAGRPLWRGQAIAPPYNSENHLILVGLSAKEPYESC